ncbi:hypothetical protein WDU94_010809 [Cyamophila willieti]
MADLSEVQVSRAVALLGAGWTYARVGQDLGVSKSTVHLVVQRFRETGQYKRRRGQGRKRATTARDDRYMILTATRNRFQGITGVRAELQRARGVQVSTSTVSRRLRQHAIRSHRAKRTPLLTFQHKLKRRTYCQNYRRWSVRQWSKGGITLGGRTALYIIEGGALTAERYVAEILEGVVLPFKPFIGDDLILMHDNARPHTAARVSRFIEEAGLEVLDHPPRSPDMNPIEHVWDYLKRQIRARMNQINTLAELKIAVVEEWDRMSQVNVDKLVRSMPRRLAALNNAAGGNTRRTKVLDIAESVGISTERVWYILHEHLGMQKLCARWVPRLLTPDQKRQRKDISSTCLTLFNKNPVDFCRRFVTCDETWIHHYTPETKEQSKQWTSKDEPAPKKAKAVLSAGKVMATVFWDARGVIFVDYLEKGQTINSAYYVTLLDTLNEKLKEKRPHLAKKKVLFHQDNAPVHTSTTSMAKLHELRWELLPHPPYSPDLAPCDYHLFPNLKKWLGGKKFASNTDLIEAVNGYFEGLDQSSYAAGINRLEHRWTKCIELKGDYVEK